MNIKDFNLGVYEPIVIFAAVLLFADLIVFVRAWSENSMSTKSIFKFLLKMDGALIISAVFLAGIGYLLKH